jgi:hypothetical protein
MTHESEEVKTFEVPEDPIIPPLTPNGPALSHALMQRLKESKEQYQHLNQFGNGNRGNLGPTPTPV